MLEKLPKALLFDVFGTCVDWRKTVTTFMTTEYTSATAKPPSAGIREMTSEYWATFSQQWRNFYKRYTTKVSQQEGHPWKTIDEVHLESLQDLLSEWKLTGIWTDEKVKEMSMIWHNLEPWNDTSVGIDALNHLTQTCTLSNGNISLLQDLCAHAKMNMTHIFSAEMFKHYKPHPATYLGAVEKLGLEPSEVAMVAAHLGDLKAAKSHGLRTIYVERPREEDWDSEKVQKAKEEQWVDVWIEEGKGGFVNVAEHLTLVRSRG